jgi:hypothetical protein
MIIYNVTTKVDHSITDDWLEWMRDEYIPAVIKTGCFTKAVILRLIETDDTEGKTFAVQYHAETKTHYNLYIQEHAASLRQQALDKWNNKTIAFNSVLEVVN